MREDALLTGNSEIKEISVEFERQTVLSPAVLYWTGAQPYRTVSSQMIVVCCRNLVWIYECGVSSNYQYASLKIHLSPEEIDLPEDRLNSDNNTSSTEDQRSVVATSSQQYSNARRRTCTL